MTIRMDMKELIQCVIFVGWITICTSSGSTPPVRREHVCTNIDVRNKVESFAQLENCTVIEGFLKILLIDYAESSDYDHLHFPELREVTDYLLLYRVYGLRSLSRIFPNLSVIRGQKLFFNYALVAFEMPNLEDIALPNLTHIVRGAVRLEKNPNLCYIDTINWTKIARSITNDDNFILQNKDIDECVNVCPANENGDSSCRVPTPDGTGVTPPLCWNSDECQKVCPAECGNYACSFYPKVRCCHEECIGGCRGPKSSDCVACKKVFYNGRCMPRCPPGTYEYRQRRCITSQECIRMGYKKNIFWKKHKGQCLEECPAEYMTKEDDVYACKPCDGPCPRVCMPKVVDSVATAQELKGCTIIQGILEIQIRGGSHVGRELEENLGLIEEVTHYVKIVRSFAIMTLHFLKNLKVIHGHQLHNTRYALFVLDNQNLQDIWDFDKHPNLTIPKGTLSFHQNRKLCLNKIDELVRRSGKEGKVDENDISRITNGDQVACNVSRLELKVLQKKGTFVIIQWNSFRSTDERLLLHYVVYYREATEQNITIFNARDACGTDVWKSKDVRPAGNDQEKFVAEVIYNLKPFTQYAMYVQTYTVAKANNGAMSPIVYFTTEPDVPTHPRDIQVRAKKHNELVVTWKPPSKPNGNVTHYQVYWEPQPLNQEKLDLRNYCKDKLHLSSKSGVTYKDSENPQQKLNQSVNGDQKCCMCPKTEEEVRQEEWERSLQIEFENFLHDSVYHKRPVPPQEVVEESGRRRRDIHRDFATNEMGFVTNSSTLLKNYTFNMDLINKTEEDYNEREKMSYLSSVVYKTEIVIPNLKHFQEYSIEVIACHDFEEGSDEMGQHEKLCSNRAITTGRTLAFNTADNIDHTNITVKNGTNIHIQWNDPPSPNGIIVTYEIEYKLVNLDVVPNKYCIPHKKYRENRGYILPSLESGNFSFRIRATSLAGNGSWTPNLYFYVADPYKDRNPSPGLIAAMIGSCVGLALMVLVAVGVWFLAKKRFHGLPEIVQYASVNPEYVSAGENYKADEWEVVRDKVELIRELGQGSFGMVWEGIGRGIVEGVDEIKVAVKTVNEGATMRDRIEFLNEASVMKAFSCNHVVKLIGVVSLTQPTLVIMELMANGDLKNFLRCHRPDEADNKGEKPPTLKQILKMAGEIADGMAYLAAKKYVHRDLAARNCMVAEGITVKIGDFGMTRDIYETDYYRKGGKGLLPVRWMAPESLKDGVFTSQSDVWSYGVVVWEMATLAAQPYQGLANEQVLKYVIDGGIMEMPEGCPDKLYDLMLQCWRHNHKQRPTFCEIVEMLVPDLDPSFKDVAYFFSEENMRERDALLEDANLTDFEEEDAGNIHTPLTGSPQLSLHRSVNNVESQSMPSGSRQSLTCESHLPCGSCSHKADCTCVEIQDRHKYKDRTYNVGENHPHEHNNGLRRENSGYSGGMNIPSSAEGSKDSSKSSGSFHLNGIANGHIPTKTYMPRFTEC